MVVEGPNDFLAIVTRLEAVSKISEDDHRLVELNECSPSEPYTTTVTILISQDPGRADLVRSEELGKFMLVH